MITEQQWRTLDGMAARHEVAVHELLEDGSLYIAGVDWPRGKGVIGSELVVLPSGIEIVCGF